jgi:hypothetical protein
MPFRTFRRVLPNDRKGKLVYTAEAGDLEVEIRAKAFPAGGSSVGPSFAVGGPELKDEDGASAGHFVMDSQWSSQVSEGDEVYAAAVEDMPFDDNGATVTILVRSEAKPKGTGPRGAGKAKAPREEGE